MPFSLTSLKFIGAGIVLAALIAAIYIWRNDIRQAAYDHIFAKQVQAAIKDKDAEIARINERVELAEKSVEKANKEAADARKVANELNAFIRSQTFSKEPVSVGLSKSLDAVQAYGRATPTVKDPTAPAAPVPPVRLK